MPSCTQLVHNQKHLRTIIVLLSSVSFITEDTVEQVPYWQC